MALYTGAYLFLQEDDKWWLVRGVSNDSTVWVDAGTGKAMDNPPSFEEPWQVPALGGMLAFDDVSVPVERILEHGLFDIEQAEIIDEQEANYGQGWDAVIHVKVKSLQKSDQHIAATREYHLFSNDELGSMAKQLGERDYTKPLLERMISLTEGTFVRSKNNRSTVTVSEVPDRLDVNEPVKSKTFYIPVILNHSHEHDRGNFTIMSSQFHDTKADNQGVECDRYIINVALLDSYDPHGKRLFGKALEWIAQDSFR